MKDDWLQNRSLGVLRGALGRSRDDVGNGRVQRSTGDLKKSTFGTSKGPKGAKRAPKEIYRADPAPPKTPLGRFLPPQNAERKKKEATLGGPWGQMYVFLEEKRLSPKWPFGPPGSSRRRLRAPRWPIGSLLKIMRAPWDLLFRPLGRPETPPSPSKKKTRRPLGPPWRRQPHFYLGKNAFCEKTKKMNKKSMCAKSCSAIVFGGPQNRLFGRQGGPKSPFQKFISEKRGLKISEL